MSQLQPRPREALTLAADGLTVDEIATTMLISEHTAKYYLGEARGALDALNTTHAVALAYQRGILLAEPADADAVALVRLAERMGYRIALVPLEDA